MNIDITTLQGAVDAIRLAQRRGAYELEESAQLAQIVGSIEQLVESFNQQHHQQNTTTSEHVDEEQ